MSTETIRAHLQNLAARIQAARQAVQIYPSSHPLLEQAFKECFAELRRLLGDDQSIQIALGEREFVLGNIQVPAEGELLEEFADTLDRFLITKLVFGQRIQLEELQRFLRLLAREPGEIEAAGGMQQALVDGGVTNIEAGSIRIDPDDLSGTGALFRAWQAYSTGVKVMRGIKTQARQTGSFERGDEAREFAHMITELAIQESRPLLAVHALKSHDDYSFTHSVNVATLTLAMANNLPFERDDLHEIAVAALLHDVGKERIPIEILHKPGKLTEEEWKVVNRHGLEGARMLCNAEGVGDLAPIVAYEHHLAYHEDLRDEKTWQPHIASQIVCLADVYDALRSKRPYRDELPADKAMQIMKGDAGKKFDPVLFEGFYRMVGCYPPGTVVRLSSGSLAVSFANNPQHPERPQVMIVRDARGEALDAPYATNLAFGEDADEIVEVLDAAEVGIDPVSYL